MRFRSSAALCAVVLFSICSADAASFDCAKAIRPVEKVICSSPKLSAADDAVAAAYRADLPRLSSAGIGLLRADQVQWLAWAQQICRVEEPEYRKAATCLTPLYTQRAQQLQSAVSVRDGLTLLRRTQFLASAESGNQGPAASSGFGTLQASWPRADSDDPLWIAWSAALEAHMLKLAGAGGARTPDGGPRKLPFAWIDAMADAQTTTLEAHVRSVEQGRVTTMLTAAGMQNGAAHPFENAETMTWILEARRTLRATDVLSGEDWRQTIGTLCWSRLQGWEGKQYLLAEVNGPESPDLQRVIADPRHWTLEKDGLHISYPDGAIAARVAHPQDAVLTWEELKPVLSPDFVKPS